MKFIVKRTIRAGDKLYRAGEIVDASGWRNLRLLLDEGRLEPVEEDTPEHERQRSSYTLDELLKLRGYEALAAVKSIDDINLLEQWRSNETRSALKREISKRIRALSKGGKR